MAYSSSQWDSMKSWTRDNDKEFNDAAALASKHDDPLTRHQAPRPDTPPFLTCKNATLYRPDYWRVCLGKWYCYWPNLTHLLLRSSSRVSTQTITQQVKEQALDIPELENTDLNTTNKINSLQVLDKIIIDSLSWNYPDNHQLNFNNWY